MGCDLVGESSQDAMLQLAAQLNVVIDEDDIFIWIELKFIIKFVYFGD